MAEEKTQRVRDPVHGLIVFRESDRLAQLAWSLLDTPEFQRLRRIKQLGVSEFVFPSATHSRFAHSIGVYHTARLLVAIIGRSLLPPAVFDVDRADVAVIAALLHDLGHGPFSHTFERVERARKVEKNHEEWTGEIIANGRGQIKPLLDAYWPGRDFCGEIVKLFVRNRDPENIYDAVVSSSFDADRLDYLRRDRMMTGTGAGAIDFDWLMDQLRVGEITIDAPEADIDDPNSVQVPTLCLGPKALPAAEQFLLARYTLHQQVYFHKTTRCIENMISLLLSRVAELAKRPASAPKNTGLGKRHPLLNYFGPDGGTITNYLALDDVVVMGGIELMTRADDPQIATLATRIRNRQLYKTLDLQEFGYDEGKQRARARWIDKQFEKEIEARSVIKDKDAVLSVCTPIGGDDEKAYKKLHILDDGKPSEISSISPLIQALPRIEFTRYYFEDADRRDAAKKRKG